MKKLTWSLLFCVALISGACNSKSQTQTEHQKQNTSELKPTERIETHQIYFVTVDNLRVRKDAQKSSPVIDKLKENTLVYSNGEISDFKEKAVLRGREHNTPYRKITYNGNTGWIYGGGLSKIYDKYEQDSFTGTLESLVIQLAYKEKSLLDRGKYILRVLQQERSGAAEWNDIMYLLAEYHLQDIASDKKILPMLEKRAWTDEEYTSAAKRNYDMLSNDFAKDFAAAGLKFSASEGIVEPIINPLKIKTAIDGPFSTTLEEYIALQQVKADNRFFSDEGIASPIIDIVDYTIMIEQFLSNQPHFANSDKLKQELKYLHSIIINGTSNSPASEYETKDLNSEWENAWNRYLQKMENGMITEKLKYELSKLK